MRMHRVPATSVQMAAASVPYLGARCASFESRASDNIFKKKVVYQLGHTHTRMSRTDPVALRYALQSAAAYGSCITGVVYLLLLPALSGVIISSGNQTFALRAEAGRVQSVSYFISTSAAAGLFGVLLTTPVVIAMTLPRLTARWFQVVALAAMYASVAFVLATPLTLAPQMHRAATATAFVVSGLNAVAHGWLYPGRRDTVSIIFDVQLAALLAFAVVGVVSQTYAVGYAFYAVEVLCIAINLCAVPAATSLQIV